MKRNKYFYLEESACQTGKYLIRIDFNLLPDMSSKGSYAVLPARLLNLSFAQYLRFCRDCVGAEIIGKNTSYPIVYFKKTSAADTLVDLLNTIMAAGLWEKEHPDWRENTTYLSKKQSEFADKMEALKNVCNIR